MSELDWLRQQAAGENWAAMSTLEYVEGLEAQVDASDMEICKLYDENARWREAAKAVVERCHGLEGYPTGCDLQLLIGALAALLEADDD